jgi:hypothetical protein
MTRQEQEFVKMNKCEEVYTECPTCGAIWGIDEIEA